MTAPLDEWFKQLVRRIAEDDRQHMKASPELIRTLIEQDQTALALLGEEPTYDPDLSAIWRNRRANLLRQLEGYWNALAEYEHANDAQG